jgi:hypothetical protein
MAEHAGAECAGSGGAAGILDGLATRVVTTYPYEFSLAATEAERAVAYRIRGEVVVDAGWPLDGIVDGLERDEFDDTAVQVIGWQDRRPVSTGRLVLPPAALPTEQACGIVVQPAGRVVDVGRMAVIPAHRTTEHAAFLALLCRLYLEVRARGYDVACGMMSRRARRLMRLLGVELEELAPERDYWGEPRTPVRFALAVTADPIRRRWTR